MLASKPFARRAPRLRPTTDDLELSKAATEGDRRCWRKGLVMVSLLRFFRLSGTLEAVSYLVLLLIAMPLKYIWHMPVFVRWTGLFHGVFFIVFSVLVAVTGYYKKWPLKITSLAFLSAFIPFGPLIFDHYFLPKTPAKAPTDP